MTYMVIDNECYILLSIFKYELYIGVVIKIS